MEIFGVHKESGEITLMRTGYEMLEKDVDRAASGVLEIYKESRSLLKDSKTIDTGMVLDKQLQVVINSLGYEFKLGEDGVLRVLNRSGKVVAEDIEPKKITEEDL